MSRAVELAKKLDIWSVEMARNQRNIEAFYHAARAEALREAAESCAEFRWEWNQMSVGATDGRYDMMEEAATACEDELRAMADREGKQ